MGSFSNISWAFPWAFLGIVPLLGLSAFLYFRRAKQLPSLQFSGLEVFKQIPQGWKARISGAPQVIKLLALLFAVIALARPQIANVKVKKNTEGIDIMLVMDISDSMLIEDMTPENRYGAAKQTVRDFIKNRVSDRIGLVFFSGEAFNKVPLTSDYKMLLDAVEEFKPNRNLKMGTAIGVGLAMAVARLKESVAKSRVIVLLTDGDNNSGTIAPEVALDIAKGYGIRIYTIGIGRDGPTQLPVYITDAFGRTVKTYQPFTGDVNDKLLGQLAEETGGKYFRATETRALQEVFKQIDRLEKTKIDVNRYTKYAEVFQDYLKWALLFYLFGFILSRTFLRRSP